MPDVLMISCPNCSASNRVPRARLNSGKQPVCGVCKTPLPLNFEPLTLTDATFAAELERSNVPVLVDMWAPWCGPCRMLAPVLDEIAGEMGGRARIAKLNVDENPNTSARFAIRSIPAMLIFKNGQEVDRLVGVQPKAEIARRLERAIG